MLVRYKLCVAQIPQQLNTQIWNMCLRTFCDLLSSMSKALSAAAAAAPSEPEQKTSESWLCVINVSSEFLFPKTQQLVDATSPVSSSAEVPSSVIIAETDKGDSELLDTLVDCYLSHGTDSSVDSRYSECDSAMVTLSTMGGAAAEQGRDKLCCSCFRALFHLASTEHAHDTLISVAAPVMLTRSIEVIEQYLRKDEENVAAEAGIVEHQLFLQLRCILREATVLKTCLPNNVHPSLAACPFEDSKHKHAIVLYPLLCDLVTVQDATLKPEIKGLLKLVGNMFFNCAAATVSESP